MFNYIKKIYIIVYIEMNYTIFLCAKDVEMLERPLSKIKDDENIMKNIKILVGRHNSFSEMINNCILMCKTEIFIYSSHRIILSEENINKIIKLINEGYGTVGLYHFAFFGCHMDLFKKIGLFDEHFIPGGYEDDDIQLRLMANNIAMYDEENENVGFMRHASTWVPDANKVYDSYKWFHIKYSFDYENKIIRRNYNDNNTIESEFKKFNESKMQKLRSLFYRKNLYLFQII